jgi:predicted DNA binding CopG/RHH family protein
MNRTRKQKLNSLPKFDSEAQEAAWWSSAAGRSFLKAQSSARKADGETGSALVKRLNRKSSVQIALRLAAPDLDKAREIAHRKGIGYQTLLKMLLHEGLQREARRR